MDRRKKDAENRILEKFISQESLGTIAISIEESETPDFIIKTLNSKISIELTQVINPTLKQREEAQNRIVNNALSKFKSQRNDVLKVYVDFTFEPLEYTNTFLNQLSNELTDFVVNSCINNEGLDFRVSTRNRPQYHKYFKSISVNNTLNFENWQSFGAFLVPYIDEDWFRSRIVNKEEKIPKYFEEFDENWLLLSCDFGHESSAFRYDKVKRNFINSNFDKIYLYQYFSNTITILKE